MHVEAVHTSGFLLANPLREVLGSLSSGRRIWPLIAAVCSSLAVTGFKVATLPHVGRSPLYPTAVIFLSYPVHSH